MGCGTQDSGRRIALMKQYFLQVGDKACCFEDLKPYLDLEENELSEWTAYLESVSQTFVSHPHVQLQLAIDMVLEDDP